MRLLRSAPVRIRSRRTQAPRPLVAKTHIAVMLPLLAAAWGAVACGRSGGSTFDARADAALDASAFDGPLAEVGAADRSGPETSAGSLDGGCWRPLLMPALDEAEQACSAMAEGICESTNRCAQGVLERYRDIDTCRARAALGCADLLKLPGAAPASALVACANQLKSASCRDLHGAQRFEDEERALVLYFNAALRLCGIRGSRPHRDPCQSPLQCADGHCGQPGDSVESCSNCALIRKRGEPCFAEGTESTLPWGPCEPGLYCRLKWECKDGGGCARAGSSCEPLGAAGDECPTLQIPNPSWSVGCEMGLHCVEGRCRALAQEGESCDPSGPRFCDRFKGLVCGLLTGKCEKYQPPTNSLCAVRRDGEECPASPEHQAIRPCLYPASCSGATLRCELPAVTCTR
jgi:hypothetical protein